MSQGTNLDHLSAALREHVPAFVDRVRRQAGAALLGFTAYGTPVSGAGPGGRHNFKSVLVLSHVNLDLLRQIGANGREFGPRGFAAPLVMTPDYIAASRDSFPLELLEIAQQRLTLCGTDYFAELECKDADVRLQCERELKTIMIGMHHGALSNPDDDELLDTVEQHTAGSLLRVLRGILWLKDVREPKSEVALVEAAEAIAGRSFAGLRQAVEPDARHGWRQFRELYDDVDALRRLIDAW